MATIAPSPRELIMALETTIRSEIEAGNLTAIDPNEGLTHQFAPGVYMRTLRIKKGSRIVGKIHKHAHPNILSPGEVIVFTEGGGQQHLVGPVEMISPAGTKRALLALTDCVWTTIHVTNETDLEKLEEYVIAPSFEAYEQFLKLEGKDMQKIEVSA